MSDVLELMAAPFVACVVLVGIHAYLGMHVIQRKVIFVDLALAQIAALGSTVAVLLGHDLHSNTAYLLSLGATFIGAALFAVSHIRVKGVPQEAIIGITFVVASAVTILVAAAFYLLAVAPPSGAPPFGANFPRRNRIIAALSLGELSAVAVAFSLVVGS